MYLAQNLKYLREQKGFNQKELSDVLGMSRAAIGNWENGSRTPNIETIVKVAGLYGVTIDELVLKRPPMPLYTSNLRHLRAMYRLTKEDMARMLGHKRKREYDEIEDGTKASDDDLEKLADFFGVTLDQLVEQDLSKEDGNGKIERNP